METPAAARRLEAFRAAAPLRSGAVFAEYETLFFNDPKRPSDPTEGLKAAQLATKHARTSVLRNAIFAQLLILAQTCSCARRVLCACMSEKRPRSWARSWGFFSQ